MIVASFLAAICLAPTQSVAQATTTTQPEFSCFVNSYTLAQFTECYFVGEGVPNAEFETGAGTYRVVCSYDGGCDFTFTPRSPFRPTTIEP
jgi:hypothetical protein